MGIGLLANLAIRPFLDYVKIVDELNKKGSENMNEGNSPTQIYLRIFASRLSFSFFPKFISPSLVIAKLLVCVCVCVCV